MKESILVELSKDFATKVLPITERLKIRKEFVFSDQLGRSSTSVGANISEAQFASSPRDFIAKISISLKEANESMYWLYLLYDKKLITENEYKELKRQCGRLIYYLSKSIKTCKINHNMF